MMKNGRNKVRKNLSFAGAGIALGAAFGILFGMLLFDNPWIGPAVGAVGGLLIAALAELYQNRRDKS
jgi:uncharacterized membrane protein